MSDHIPDPTKMIGDTPISDSTPHNVADLGMLCRKLERQLNVANERIKRLEEAGNELRECASRIGTVASGEGSVIRRTQDAIQAWEKEAKL
jgi:hypothetical protein